MEPLLLHLPSTIGLACFDCGPLGPTAVDHALFIGTKDGSLLRYQVPAAPAGSLVQACPPPEFRQARQKLFKTAPRQLVHLSSIRRLLALLDGPLLH